MEMGLISPGGENFLDFLELRQVLSTYDRDLRDPLWWPQERPDPGKEKYSKLEYLSERVTSHFSSKCMKMEFGFTLPISQPDFFLVLEVFICSCTLIAMQHRLTLFLFCRSGN